MYCPECSEYIPQGLGLTSCPKCHLALAEVEKLVSIKKELQEKQIQIEQSIEVEKQNRSRGITRFNPVQLLFLCFFSKEAYDDVHRNWTGGCLFFLLLVTLVTLPSLLIRKTDDNFSYTKYQQITKSIVQQIPDMKWSSGNLSIDAPSPHYIKSMEGTVLAAIDTSGELKSLSDIPAWLLVTENAYFLKKDNNQVQSGFFSPQINFSFNRAFAEKILSFFELWIVFICYPTIWITIWMFLIFCVAIYCLMNRFFAFILRLKMSWGALFRITAISSFPALVIEGYCLAPFMKVEGVADWATNILPLVYSVAYLVYLKLQKNKEIAIVKL